jgi:hypothetical protein
VLCAVGSFVAWPDRFLPAARVSLSWALSLVDEDRGLPSGGRAQPQHPSHCRDETRQCDGSLDLIVSDDGRGGAVASRGSGLTGLVDRVEAIGGAIYIESRAGSGTIIHVKLPIASTCT